MGTSHHQRVEYLSLLNSLHPKILLANLDFLFLVVIYLYLIFSIFAIILYYLFCLLDIYSSF